MKGLLAALLIGLVTTPPAAAQQLIEAFHARIGPQDQYNSNGQRLATAAAIIRQDRANFHRFGRRDSEDEPDRYFADANSRAALERMLARGGGTAAALAAIVNGNPIIRVEIWRDGPTDFVRVIVF